MKSSSPLLIIGNFLPKLFFFLYLVKLAENYFIFIVPPVFLNSALIALSVVYIIKMKKKNSVNEIAPFLSTSAICRMLSING